MQSFSLSLRDLTQRRLPRLYIRGAIDKFSQAQVPSNFRVFPAFGGGMRSRRVLLIALVFCFSSLAFSQDLASFEKRITTRKLANGLTVIICERPEAPVFSFLTHVDAGSVQDPMAKTGLAHMFEHMAFKGTDKIGTRDYEGEKKALQKVEEAYATYLAERE